VKKLSEKYLIGTTEIARKTIPFMSKKRIPLSPDNYRVWYEYFRGGIRELCEEIEKLLGTNARFDERLNEELYNKFLAPKVSNENEEKLREEMQAVNEASQASQKIIEPIAKSLEDLSGHNLSYGTKLNDLAAQATENNNTKMLGKIIDTLVNETKAISADNQRMSGELNESSQSLEDLTKKLEDARIEARIDDLTGLQNRRAFNEALAREVRLVEDNGVKSCLALIDIDNFKRVNDTCGHPAGDRVLREIACVCSENFSSQDLIFRYGGEEFTAILQNTSLQRSLWKLEKLRQEINEYEFDINGAVLNITVSIGLAKIDVGRSEIACQKMADDAMYLAKNSGKNNIKSEIDLKEENA